MNTQIAYLTAVKRLLTFLDGIGSVGALFAAIAAPCCFPLFVGAIAAVGLSALGKFEGFVALCLAGVCVALLVWLGTRRSATPQPLAVRARRNQRRRFSMVFLWHALRARTLRWFVRLARRDRLEPFLIVAALIGDGAMLKFFQLKASPCATSINRSYGGGGLYERSHSEARRFRMDHWTGERSLLANRTFVFEFALTEERGHHPLAALATMLVALTGAASTAPAA